MEENKKIDVQLDEKETEQEIIYQIFDKVFKKVITLSAKSVVNLINGLFGTDYPLDSTVHYNWTEFEDDRLRRILADTILTINGTHSYHMEAQMEKDNAIVFRVFDYGFQHANRTRVMDVEEGKYVLSFPQPVVIYLYYEGVVPDIYTLILEKDTGEKMCEYRVPVVKVQDISAEELSERKMIVLLPFHILKLRQLIKEKSIQDALPELKRIINDDIIGNINRNVELGNIEVEDAVKLKKYLIALRQYLARYHKELEAMKDMTDESFMTDVDILCEKWHKELDEKQAMLDEKQAMLDERQALIEKLQQEIESMKLQKAK